MNPGRQDPVESIEAALATLRQLQRHGGPHRAPGSPDAGPHGGPPWMQHPRHGPGRSRARFGDMVGAARFRMLEALLAGGASVSELAEKVGVDQPRASRLVTEASMRGLVERGPDPTDARRMIITITDAGRSLLDGMRASRRSRVEEALTDFTAKERAALADLLTRFTAALRDHHDTRD